MLNRKIMSNCEGTEQLQFHFDHDFHEEDF